MYPFLTSAILDRPAAPIDVMIKTDRLTTIRGAVAAYKLLRQNTFVLLPSPLGALTTAFALSVVRSRPFARKPRPRRHITVGRRRSRQSLQKHSNITQVHYDGDQSVQRATSGGRLKAAPASILQLRKQLLVSTKQLFKAGSGVPSRHFLQSRSEKLLMPHIYDRKVNDVRLSRANARRCNA